MTKDFLNEGFCIGSEITFTCSTEIDNKDAPYPRMKWRIITDNFGNERYLVHVVCNGPDQVGDFHIIEDVDRIGTWFDEEDFRCVIADGFIRFDACSNWLFYTEQVMMHLCGEGEVFLFAKAMSTVYTLAREIGVLTHE